MGRKFSSVEDVLDFAIANEIEANELYTELAGRMKNPAMARVFEEFALEELGHKAKLEAVKTGEFVVTEQLGAVENLEIADYMVDVEPRPDMDYADALILAMKKEKAAYRLYLDLAAVAESKELTDLFLMLAQEEARHKLRFEIEYDDEILKED